MRFWDTSAVVPLLVPEIASERCASALAEDRIVVVWALTPVEAMSALYRKHREGGLDDGAVRQARRRLESLRGAWNQIQEMELVARRAERLLAIHPLRAADALQLAAALVVCGEDPRTMALVSLDDKLTHAARREGFEVLP